jgi:hypothetical protein
LKNHGALSEYSKFSQSSTKIKKVEILTLFPGYDVMVKKTISRYVPETSEQRWLTNDFLGIMQNLAVHAERGSSFCQTLHMPKSHLTSEYEKLKYFPK